MSIFLVLVLTCGTFSIAGMYDMSPEAAALVGGITAGATEPLGGQPLTTWKNYRQLGKPLSDLRLKEFWRGAPIASLALGVNTGVQAGLYACFLPYIDSPLLASLAAGACSAYLIAGPTELLIAQQQLQRDKLFSTLCAVYARAGVRGCFRGCNWVAAREAGFSAGYLCIAPHSRIFFTEQGAPDFVASVGGGIWGGLVAMTVTHPLDTIKTTMAADVPATYGASVRYRSGFDVLKNAKPATLFRGCFPRLLNGTVAITWFAWCTPYVQQKLHNTKDLQ